MAVFSLPGRTLALHSFYYLTYSEFIFIFKNIWISYITSPNITIIQLSAHIFLTSSPSLFSLFIYVLVISHAQNDESVEWFSKRMFKEEFELDLEGNDHEEIHVPDFGLRRHSRFIHDFKVVSAGKKRKKKKVHGVWGTAWGKGATLFYREGGFMEGWRSWWGRNWRRRLSGWCQKGIWSFCPHVRSPMQKVVSPTQWSQLAHTKRSFCLQLFLEYSWV